MERANQMNIPGGPEILRNCLTTEPATKIDIKIRISISILYKIVEVLS